jgi:tetratricopeptide (TPR) repeat protein
MSCPCDGRLARIITDIVRQAAKDAGRDDDAAAAMAASADDFVRGCFADDSQPPITVHVNNESIKLEPRNASGYYGRGLTRDGMNDRENAIADYSRAIELDPRFDYALHNRALDYAVKGNFDAAIEGFSSAKRAGASGGFRAPETGAIEPTERDCAGAESSAGSDQAHLGSD